MKRWLSAMFLCGAMAAAHAAPVTISFSGSGFGTMGSTAHPGFDGPVQGSFSWETNALSDPIAALTAIDLTIAGHAYSLTEVDVFNALSGTSSVLGAKVRGVGVLVGDGLADDFMLMFDRVSPQLLFLGYTIAGKSGTLWSNPTQSAIQFLDAPDGNRVPEPASLWLLVCTLLALGLHQAARTRRAASSSYSI